MKYSVLIAEKRDGDKIVIDVNELNEFMEKTCKEVYDEGYKAGMRVVQPNDYPWKVVPTWSDKTTPDYLSRITCVSAPSDTITTTTTGKPTTIKYERDPENPFYITGVKSV